MSDAASPTSRQLLSVVIPAFNETAVLHETHRQLSAVAPELADVGLDVEFVFVNDGSSDGTADALDALATADPRVRAVHLTRNFGHQAAISAGLEVARGDAVAIIDCDLQDPPGVLPRFVARWREGYQVVYAVRRERKESPPKRLAYWAFYRLMAWVAELDVPLDSGDFCLMDRSAVDLLNRLPERQRFVRGLRTWVGLKQVGVEYERAARFAGEPKYTFRKLLGLAADGLVSFSGAPLRLVTRLGVLCGAISVGFGIWTAVDGFFHVTNAPPGWASTACLITFVGSVQLLSLGIIGEYLSRIFVEVKGRPTYLIARVTEMTPSSADRPVNSGPGPADQRGANDRATVPSPT